MVLRRPPLAESVLRRLMPLLQMTVVMPRERDAERWRRAHDRPGVGEFRAMAGGLR